MLNATVTPVCSQLDVRALLSHACAHLCAHLEQRTGHPGHSRWHTGHDGDTIFSLLTID